MEKVSETEFNNVINSDKKTVVKFFVDWCPDCKRSLGFDNEIEKEFSTVFDFYCINADDYPQLKTKNGVRGYPSYLIYKNGEKIAHLHSKWTKSKEQVADFLEKNVSGRN